MRFHKVYLVLFASAAACSSPRYTYYFPQKVDRPVDRPVASKQMADPIISRPEANVLVASTQVIHAQQPRRASASKGNSTKVAELNAPMTKVDTSPKATDTPAAATKTNKDGKLGIIFFVAGVVVYIIGGPVFTVVGALSMMIGVIFGIKWLLRK